MTITDQNSMKIAEEWKQIVPKNYNLNREEHLQIHAKSGKEEKG